MAIESHYNNYPLIALIVLALIILPSNAMSWPEMLPSLRALAASPTTPRVSELAPRIQGSNGERSGKSQTWPRESAELSAVERVGYLPPKPPTPPSPPLVYVKFV